MASTSYKSRVIIKEHTAEQADRHRLGRGQTRRQILCQAQNAKQIGKVSIIHHATKKRTLFGAFLISETISGY